jgi:type II secretory pathway pseudopilin PulG
MIKGETLVEITVSLGIIAVALTGATMLIASVTHTITNNKLKSQGTAYAEEGTELARTNIKNCGCIANTAGQNFTFAGTTLTPTSPTTLAVGQPGTEVTGSNPTFFRVVNIKQLSPSDKGASGLLPSTISDADTSKYWLVDSQVKWTIGNTNESTSVKTVIAGG